MLKHFRKLLEADRKMRSIEELATKRGSTGGLLKRIDENRELLEFLQTKAPDLVSSHFWLDSWIYANDRFFTQLDGILDIPNPRPRHENYPRPWPGRKAPEYGPGGTSASQKQEP